MFGRRRPRASGTASAPPSIAGYRDLQLIGSGGFSKVYTAYQERFARTVAVKVITVELSDDALRRFRREQLTAGQLDGHPHVIRVYESGTTDDGLPYLTMEHHEQGSLADRLRRQGPLPLDEVLSIGVKLASALDAAHRRGIVHRDVKPQNVLVSPFLGPVLADFGIAAFDDARLQTITGEAFSVLHVAPEVLEGDPATPAADLYSLVSTLYELLAGRAPFAGDAAGDDDTRSVRGGPGGGLGAGPRARATPDAGGGLLQHMRRVRTGTVPPIDRPDVPSRVTDELVALLAKDPAARPASALALAERLRSLESDLGLPPTPLIGTNPAPDRGSGASPSPPDTAIALGPTPDARTPVGPPPGITPPPTGGRAGAPSAAAGVAGDDGSATRTFHRPVSRPVPTEEEGGRRGLWMALGGAAVGLVVLAVGAWLVLGGDGGDDEARRSETSTTTASGQAGAPPPCPDAATGELTLPPVEFGEGVPPTLLEVEVSGDGTAATVRWDDPNGGRNPYLVFVRCDAPDRGDQLAVDVVAAGEATEVTVDGLPLEHNYCFTVGVLEPSGTATPHTAPDGTHFRCLDQTTY